MTAVRETIALRCSGELGLSAAEIARHAGVNTSAVTRTIERAGQKLRQGDNNNEHQETTSNVPKVPHSFILTKCPHFRQNYLKTVMQG